jgi:hypothetical protein
LPSEVGATRPYRVDHDGSEIIIRVRSDLISREEMIDLLDFILLQKFCEDLSLSDAEIEALAKDAKRSIWQRLRPMVEEKLERSVDTRRED